MCHWCETGCKMQTPAHGVIPCKETEDQQITSVDNGKSV